MDKISPAAQEVLDAYWDPGIKGLEHRQIAAAFRAAASIIGSCTATAELLAIAAELEGR